MSRCGAATLALAPQFTSRPAPPPPAVPVPPHRAREELRQIFKKVVTMRRESGTREEDVLQQFIDAK